MTDHVEAFGLDALPLTTYPLTYSTMQKNQQDDPELLKKLTSSSKYSTKLFNGGKNVPTSLIWHGNKITIPLKLQNNVAEWYHTTLCHPDINQMEQTICQPFTWKSLTKDNKSLCNKCHTCQVTKLHKNKVCYPLN